MSEPKRYAPMKIPDRNSHQEHAPDAASPTNAARPLSFEQSFAEIEIDSKTAAAFEPAPIPKPAEAAADPVRKIFTEMRDIARKNYSPFFSDTRFYQKQSQYEASKIFYKQAVFMKDFEDDYPKSVPFSAYFPYYQLLSYEQLRTYFTWRTKVRSGSIESTSLSYAFMYIYELLNNIGLESPADGLYRLLSFWRAYKAFDTGIEKYLVKWIKDYHIYYELPQPFAAFITENGLQSYYQDITAYHAESSCRFEKLSVISKYNIRKSGFFDETTSRMLADCFNAAADRLRAMLADAGMRLDNLIYQVAAGKAFWTPFSGALFYPTVQQTDRRVVFSDSEIYVCSRNKWQHSRLAATEGGKQLAGYIMKQTESVLRKLTGYPYKLTANINSVDGELRKKLGKAGISLENLVTDSVTACYRELTKTVVTVDVAALEKIRLEALDTQEKLIVSENNMSVPNAAVIESPADDMQPAAPQGPGLSDGWSELKAALNDIELKALAVIIEGGNAVRYANENDIMPEVLADGINEKAVDHIGDSILDPDDGMMIYDEYRDMIVTMLDVEGIV